MSVRILERDWGSGLHSEFLTPVRPGEDARRVVDRCGDVARRSAQNLEIFFGREAPRSAVALFDRS